MNARFLRWDWVTAAVLAAWLALAAASFIYADRAAAGRRAEERLAAAWAEGKAPHWRQVTRVWLPRAAFINGWLLLVAAAATPWARRSLAEPPGAPPPADTGADPARLLRLGWFGVAVLAGVAAWSTAPRLRQSVWGDEARTLREFIVGQYHLEENGALRYDAATWGDAFFNFRTPNNHVLYSLAARASHQWFGRPPVEGDDAYFSEWAMRLPAWLAGIGAIISLAALGAAVGWRRAGWVAAALLALHPAFVRYAAEARGYAFLLVLSPLLLVALTRAAATGRWRWWVLAAAVDFALLYTWPLSLYFVAVANLGVLAALGWTGDRCRRDRLTLMLRWFISALGAAAVWIQLFLPNVIQLRFWLRGSSARGVSGDNGWIDALATMMTGRVWREMDAANPLLTPWVRTWQAAPWVVVGLAAVLLLAIGAGVVAGWRRTPALRPWIPALLIPPILILVQAAFSGSVLYPWYLVSAVPGILLLVAIGLDVAAAKIGPSPVAESAMLGAGVIALAMAGTTTRRNLRQHPIEPNREASLVVQPVINPHHPDYQRHVLTAGFLMRNTIYDPGVREFSTVGEMRELMDEAGRTGRDFVIIYGQRDLAREAFPEVMAVIEDPAVFQPVATLFGQEGYCTRHVVRHRASR